MTRRTDVPRGTSPEQAIAAAIEEQWDGEYDPAGPDTPRAALESVVSRMAQPFVHSADRTLAVAGASVWEPLQADIGPDALWTDLRPSEAARLMTLVEAAVDRAAAACSNVIRDELAVAGAAFAAEFADLPLARTVR